MQHKSSLANREGTQCRGHFFGKMTSHVLILERNLGEAGIVISRLHVWPCITGESQKSVLSLEFVTSTFLNLFKVTRGLTGILQVWREQQKSTEIKETRKCSGWCRTSTGLRKTPAVRQNANRTGSPSKEVSAQWIVSCTHLHIRT